MPIPPPPTGSDPGSYAAQDWYNKLIQYLNVAGAVPWSVVDKAGANITDIPNRSHSNLQTLQGGAPGEYYHLTLAEKNSYAPKDSPAFTTAVGFNGTTPKTKITVTGSRGGNAALASLLTALANYGLITDSTTA